MSSGVGFFRVDANYLSKTAEEIKGLVEEYFNHYKKLVEAEEQLNGMWDGPANDAFHKKFDSYKPSFEDVRKLLMEYYDILTQSAKEYGTTEQRVIDAIKVN